MLSIAEALDRILAEVPRAGLTSVDLSESFDRVAAVDVVAPLEVPHWDNSAMDGFAVRAADALAGAILSVRGEASAGHPAGTTVSSGTVLPITTGTPVPDGADAVVIVENTTAVEGGIRIEKTATPGDNIRRAGCDIALGDVLMRAGERVTPGRAALCASVGMTEVTVHEPLRVAILPTGDELVEPGNPLQHGQIYSSNPIALAGLVREAGAVPIVLSSAGDDLPSLVAAMEAGLAADVLLTTGGVSVGKYDLVKPALAELGVPMDFWKVRMKPGKPLAFGKVDRGGRCVPVFGLPGNPVSCMVNFLQFVRPWIRSAYGQAPFLGRVQAVAMESIRERPGRAKLIRVLLERTDAGFTCRSTGSQSSGVLSSMARAHGLLVRSPEEGSVQAGEVVSVQLLDPDIFDARDAGF